MQPQLTGRRREDGRVPEKEDIRIWNLMLMAGGGRGIVYTRWRPLLNGPLFDGFAPYAMDGGRTERSEMASRMAKWANDPAQKKLWEARPVTGDVHILFVPECENASFLLSQSGGEPLYLPSVEGAYQGFFSQNIQADFVHIDQLEKASIIYFPFPVAMSEEHARALMNWVEQGGVLISEACPGFFTEHMNACAVQPGQELGKLFGVCRAEAEFMPDLAGEVSFEMFGESVQGGGFTQFYTLDGAEEAARYNGRIIAAEHSYGAGRTLLIGSGISLGGQKNRGIWRKLLKHFGIRFHAQVSDPGLMVRIHENGDRRVMWVVNSERENRKAEVRLQGRWKSGYVYWNGGEIQDGGQWGSETCQGTEQLFWVSAEPRNALIVELCPDI